MFNVFFHWELLLFFPCSSPINLCSVHFFYMLDVTIEHLNGSWWTNDDLYYQLWKTSFTLYSSFNVWWIVCCFWWKRFFFIPLMGIRAYCIWSDRIFVWVCNEQHRSVYFIAYSLCDLQAKSNHCLKSEYVIVIHAIHHFGLIPK